MKDEAQPRSDETGPQRAEDLSAFSDQDAIDRGMGQGTFRSDHHDRVELGTPAPALRSEGPRLDDATLAAKVVLASDALRRMAAIFEGVGQDGAAQLQLLLEATPRQLRPLFAGVQLAQDGGLDAAALTRNLRSRLPSEQPSLLQQGLSDLLGRALSHCLESVDGDTADALLGEVLGLQKRLGI